MTKSELRSVSGVEGQYPVRTADGKEIVYYCVHCQEKPSVADNQEARILAHDACTIRRWNVLYPALEKAVFGYLAGNTPEEEK